jgi:hypothetical protein
MQILALCTEPFRPGRGRFALDELDWATDVFVADLSAAAPSRGRLPLHGRGQHRRAADGELAGARPGSLLRPGR